MNKHSNKILILICILVFISGCSEKEKKSKSYPAKSKINQDNLLASEKEDSLFNWNNIQKQEGYFYAVGIGRSADPLIAQKKAELQARIKLAEQIKASDFFEFDLSGSYIKARQQEKSGNIYKVKLLMELKPDSLSPEISSHTSTLKK